MQRKADGDEEVVRAQMTAFLLKNKQITAQVGCMRQVLGSGALGRPRGIGLRGRWEV